VSLLVAGMSWVLAETEVRDVELTNFGFYAHKQTTDALIGGCGPIYRAPLDASQSESGTVPAKDKAGISNRLTYSTVVPMFGEFWDDPAPADQSFWSRSEPETPNPENLLRNMWDGEMVVYYTAAVDEAALKVLHDVLVLRPELDLKVVPWDSTVRGPLPQNRHIAFATWNASQSCHQLIAPALYDFRDANPATQAPGYDGTEPPVRSTKRPINVVQ
jgi:hypothetical protein